MTRTALVLGAGGVTGIAWQLGVLIGLRRRGVDPTGADLIVGTSAGAVTGAVIATGVDPETAATVEERVDTPIRPDWMLGAQAFALLGDASLAPVALRAAVGALALRADVGDEEPFVASLGRRLPVHDWPVGGRLLVTGVDAVTGELVTWNGAEGAPLVRAVAASCAVPCVLPAVTVLGRRYVDGGLRGYTNADLATGAESIIVLAPRSPLRLRRSPSEESAVLADTRRTLVISPDRAALEAVGPNAFDASRWQPTLDAGAAQGSALAEAVAARIT